ncbi:MAG: hypothetical protein JWQ11_960 [Rhizobacter sp.]|nr:hypothetical protein [Rhizobacter sp.]
MEGFIKGEVDSGFYSNATEVLRDAVRELQEKRSRTRAWHAAIKLGLDDLEAGRSYEYNTEMLEDITRRAMDEMDNNDPISPDVLP